VTEEGEVMSWVGCAGSRGLGGSWACSGEDEGKDDLRQW
jgi:hypothetical protein